MSSRRICVAGVEVKLCGNSRAQKIIDRRYENFLIPEHSGRLDARVDLELSVAPGALWSGEIDTLIEDGEDFEMTGAGISGRIRKDASYAHLRAPCSERAIDGVLRYLLSAQFLKRGGLLLHASAQVYEEQAFVFAGRSGCGKSTLATHLEGRCLADEGVLVFPGIDNVVAHATPYWNATPGQAPVSALFFPQSQREENSISALAPARALAKLLSCTGPLLPTSLPAAMDVAQKLVTQLAPNMWTLTLCSKSAIRNWLQPKLAQY